MTINTIRWFYDNAYRLTSEERYGGGVDANNIPTGTKYRQTNYVYDDAGNRTKETVDGVVTDYVYNKNDQITTVTKGGVVQTYTYDPRGNLKTIVEGTTTLSAYTFDARDRMTSTTMAGTTSTYAYDHDGHRITQTVGGISTYYLWDEFSPYSDIVLETDTANTPLVSYVLGNGQIISQARGTETSYFLPDAQGSTRTLTDESGAITDTFNYFAFGTMQSRTGTTVSNYLYTGQQFDDATDFYSLRARYYAPEVGRFLSRDTWAYDFQNPIELNRYGYVAGNPVNWVDPTGLLLEGLSLTRWQSGFAYGVAAFGQFTTQHLVKALIFTAIATAVNNHEVVLETIQQIYLTNFNAGIYVAGVGFISFARELTPDEVVHVERIDNLPKWLEKHPDLEQEADEVDAGRFLDQGADHVREAHQELRSIEKAIRTLQISLRSLNPNAQKEAIEAMERGKEAVKTLRRLLNLDK